MPDLDATLVPRYEHTDKDVDDTLQIFADSEANRSIWH
jgi:hypothetical protein